jgi:predicted kinase
VDFYKAYRAVVRGKVALLTAADPALDGARRTVLRQQAMGYLQLAVGYELGPALVLLCGLPGSGKSFLAPHLARPLRAMVLHADVRRKQRAGLAADDSARAGYGQGLYSDEQRRATYRSLLEDASAALESGRSVVVDASFARREFRAPFLEAAARLGRACCIAHVVAAEDVVRERLTAPPGTRTGSDADVEVYLHARAAFEAPEESPRQVVELRSGDGLPEDASGRVVDRLVELVAG